jgi:hypothetical protein
LPIQRREGLLRRLNAEAEDERKFVHAEMSGRIQEIGQQGFALGPVGFDVPASLVTILLPGEPNDRPMALGFVHHRSDEIDPMSLISVLQRSVSQCVDPRPEGGSLTSIANAA